jgi:hypothetical protein
VPLTIDIEKLWDQKYRDASVPFPVDGAGSGVVTEADVQGLQSDLNGKAPLNSPAFTGTPTAPTPSVDDESTRLATTSYVASKVAAGGGGGGAGSPLTYAVMNGNTASAWQTTDKAALDITVVADMRVLLANLIVLAPSGTSEKFITKYQTSGAQRSYEFGHAYMDGLTTNSLVCNFSPDGVSVVSLSSAPMPITLIGSSRKVWLRCLLTSNVSGQSTAAFGYSYKASPGPSDFIPIGNTATNATPGPFFAGTAPLIVGGRPDGLNALHANVYHAQVWNGTPTLLADFDMTPRTGTTSFSDGLGNTWTPGGSPVNGIDANTYPDVSIQPSALKVDASVGNGFLLKTRNGLWEPVPSREIDPLDYGAVFSGNLTNSSADTAGMVAAMNHLALTGARSGGKIVLPNGIGYVDRPLIVQDHVNIQGLSSGGASIIQPSPNFPTNTVSGSLTLPLTSATVTVTGTIHPNWPTTGGVVTVISDWGATEFTYEAVSGNTFTGCNGGIGNVTTGAVLGSPVFIGGQPNLNGLTSQSAFGSLLSDFMIYCGSSGTPASGIIPGCTGYYSNRIQEHGGLERMTFVQMMQKGVCIDWARARPATAQNYILKAVRVNMAGQYANANAVGIDIHGWDTTLRGGTDITVSAYQSGSPAQTVGVTGLRLIECGGTWGDAQIEYTTTAVLLDDGTHENGSTACNGPIEIRNIEGQNTNQVKIIAGGTRPITLENIRRFTTGLGANLIVDNRSAKTLTDNYVGTYRLSAVATSQHWIFTDSPNVGAASPFAPVQVTSH